MSRRSATLAVAVTLALGLPACGGDSGPPTLTWYINPDAGGQAEIADRCSEQAAGEYRIETSLLPREASAQREQLARRLAAEDSSIDLISMDPPFIPEFAEAGFLADIPDDVAEAVTENVVQSAIDGATWKDELVAVPFWANTQLLWYRKSVAEAAGLDPANEPVTWQQLIDAAAQQDKYLGVQGIRAEALTVWINALVASAGGEVLTNPEAPVEDVELGLQSEAGRQAAGIIGTIARQGLGGPGFSNEDENASMLQFQGENGSFMVNWPFVWAATLAGVEEGTLDQSLIDDIGWAQYPSMVEGEPSRPPYGGINLGIGAFSEHVDLAMDAAQCIVSVENQAYYMVSNGNPASNTEAYEDPDVQETFPMADLIRESLEQAGPRPKTPYYNEVSTGLQNTWHPPSSVRPDSTPQEAATFITEVLQGERLL
ncbi:carbohydrate ABC transporter substrate-binding protein (CUT1 family) [Haloactinopolyspora alba]|uniref:Carbohydrate ABC transporter substrate-binding protein (CUT1 family) n=1 Tax=Haloactinopolyspora alba TaxID=648780 RepID=A0A2P8DX17_9ACTN|nr:extracellular solute-binding protein [Haloactinopolyspora alba]PSL01765.1 carbohydrate ABC transporter substrate-binding protein (CUT1 family) [Haloactinopolyspora alba]